MGRGAKMGGLIAGELAKEIVDFARLDVLREPGDEQGSNGVVRGLREESGDVKAEWGLRVS